MRSTWLPVAKLALMLACAGGAMSLGSVACAQDSISATTGLPSGLPGDAPPAYQTTPDTRQVLRFAVDLVPVTSSWSNRYAFGPAVKASRSNAGGFFDQLVASQAVSARFGTGQVFSSGAGQSYALWSNAPGAGINAPDNSAPAGSVAGPGLFGQRFGLGFFEFGAGPDGAFATGDDENTIIGSMIDFQVRMPNRLLVTRIAAAQNKSAPTGVGTASFGMGGIDELGNLHFYADGFTMTTSSRLNTRNLLRSRLGSRNATSVNQIFQVSNITQGTDNASLNVVRSSNTMVTVPGIMSAGLPGGAGRPVLIATDLANNFIFESAANTSSITKTYFPASVGSPRGSISFIPQPFPPVSTGADVGTAATLARTDSNTTTRAIQVFGVNANGSVTNNLTATLPTVAGTLVDQSDGFDPAAAFPGLGTHEFTNYASQASFRGGTGQVASTVLPGGDLLLAATVASNGGGSTVPQSENGYIAVARVPAAGGSPTWTIAAHTGTSAGFAGNQSKAILGRPTLAAPLTTIGRIAKFSEVYSGATNGPSLSSPAMDRNGNVYFMATIALTNVSPTRFTTGLLRANFQPGTNAYQLELLATMGDVITGANSGVPYQVQFLGVADADSVDSGSIFASSIVQDFVAGSPGGQAAYGSPASLGALTFRAKIVYDVNADGIFADPSGASSGSTSPDQAYNVVMVMMPRLPLGDFNRDGIVDVSDIFALLSAWFANAPGADWSGNGVTDVSDIFAFLGDWFSTTP